MSKTSHISETHALIQVSESNISYQGNIDDQALAPTPLGHGITFADRRDTLLKVYMTDFF